MSFIDRVRGRLNGKKRDPLNWETWRHAALVAVLAWAGVGADGLSSANYGPEEAYKAMAGHEPLVLWLALVTAVTVVIISMAYVQIIALFPNGGGGYQAASRLFHPLAGLFSGSALIVDYSLTISISIAAATDAILSLTHHSNLGLKPWLMAGGLTFLVAVNLRGMRESLSILAPIFFLFLISHVFLIGAGLYVRGDVLVEGVVSAEREAETVIAEGGVWMLLAILGTAYAAGAGTYTGIEALSNNAQALKPPRAKTGARAMALIAVSLALIAGGILLLYTVWQPDIVFGKTLNSVVFTQTLAELFPEVPWLQQVIITTAMCAAAALLLVAANAGFLGGPAVLASMSIDKWAPHGFAHLSNKLVAQNGIVTMAAGAVFILLFTGGDVHELVILYSINVFTTFTLSLTGLVRHGIQHRGERPGWQRRLLIAMLAWLVAVSILITLFVAKFTQGAWVAVTLTMLIAFAGYWVRDHYRRFDEAMEKTFDNLLVRDVKANPEDLKNAPMKRPVGIVMGQHGGAGLHALMHAQRLFRGQFDSVVIICAGEVDAECYGGQLALERLKQNVGERCGKIVSWCRDHGLPAKVYSGFSTDMVETLETLCLKAREDHPSITFVTSRPMARPHGWATTLLHGGGSLSLQRRLHSHDAPLIVLPMRIEIGPDTMFTMPPIPARD